MRARLHAHQQLGAGKALRQRIVAADARRAVDAQPRLLDVDEQQADARIDQRYCRGS